MSKSKRSNLEDFPLVPFPPEQKAAAVAAVRSAMRPAAPEAARVIYDRWSKKHYWTITEAAMLGIGLNPDFPEKFIKEVFPDELDRFHELQDMIGRRFVDRVPPLELVEWDRQNGIGLDSAVLAAVAIRNPARKPKPRPTDIAKIQRTLEKMVVAMAIDKYGYDPTVTKTPTAKGIEGAALRIGVNLSQGAILTRLKEALGESGDPDLAQAVDRYFSSTKSQLGK